MSIFTMKRGDTSPVLEAVLRDGDGTPMSLAGASVELRMKKRSHDFHLSKAASVSDPSEGVVQYQWYDGDTDVPGLYMTDFVVTFPDGSVETFPNGGYMTVHILGTAESDEDEN